MEKDWVDLVLSCRRLLDPDGRDKGVEVELKPLEIA
jgi:hypothetical protein